MPNPYFQFKKFKINQGDSAMKVCTDSCFFGAYVDINGAKNILDIGTGTGLLSLMMAQRCEARITSVEIEYKSYLQARENFYFSPWNNQIEIFHDSIQNFANHTSNKFDLIICNPPFFDSSLKSNDQSTNVALHSEKLNFKELIAAVLKLLSPKGKLWVLLPLQESKTFKEMAFKNALYMHKQCDLYAIKGGKIIRRVSCYSLEAVYRIITEDFNIKKDHHFYTRPFKKLLEDFYLDF